MQRGGRGSLRPFATHTLAADQLTATRPVGRERIARPRQSRLVAGPRQTMLARVRERLLPHVRQLHRARVHSLELGGGELGGALLLSAGALQLHVGTDRRAVVRQPAHLLAQARQPALERLRLGLEGAVALVELGQLACQLGQPAGAVGGARGGADVTSRVRTV